MAGEVCRRFLWTLVRIESEHAKTRKMPSLGDSDTAKTSDHVDEIMVAVPALQGRARDEAHPWTPTRSWGQIRERVNVARVLSSQRESGTTPSANALREQFESLSSAEHMRKEAWKFKLEATNG